jgi:transposase-like protein
MSAKRYPERTRQRFRRFVLEDGLSITEAALKVRVPRSTASAWLDEDERPGPTPRQYDRELILAEVDAGVDRKTIQARHGCSARWLSDLINGRLAL